MGQQSAGGGPTSDATAGVPQAGDVVGGKFVVERVIGIGGMGVVVAAHHKHLEQTVAIKFLRRDAAKDEMAVNRFLREARAAIALQSEHVVRVMDASRLDDGLPYLVMEYLSGQDLDQMLAARGRLPLAEAVEYLLQAMEAVADAHAAGIVHRDLKPSNLFITQRPDGSPHLKVLDFGISKAFDVTGAKQPSLTMTSMTLGSPLYMSPEQVRSSKTVDARTDVWALGVIAYELLAGIQPFEAETVTSLCAKIVADDPPSLRSIRPDVPADFEAVVLKCLEKSPSSRYQSVIQLASALRPFASADGLASVARIVRSGGVLKPTLASAPERISQPSARAVTPVSTDSGTQPTQSDPGYAETVASWQETGDRRTKQVRTAGLLTACALAMLAFVAVAMKWQHATPAPSGAAQPAVSAASVIAPPPVAATLPAAATSPVATTSLVAPVDSVPVFAATADVKPATETKPAVTTPAATHVAASAPKRATPVKASAGVASAKTTDDLLLDRK